MGPAQRRSGDGVGEPARGKRRRLQNLAHGWQFRRCYDSGKKLVARHAIIFLLPAAASEGVRVGVVASRKVGGAVQRNRAKRVLREAARGVGPKWIDRHIWVVLVAKASAAEAGAVEVQDDIERALVAGGELEIE